MTKRIASREFFPVPMQLIIVHVIVSYFYPTFAHAFDCKCRYAQPF